MYQELVDIQYNYFVLLLNIEWTPYTFNYENNILYQKEILFEINQHVAELVHTLGSLSSLLLYKQE